MSSLSQYPTSHLHVAPVTEEKFLVFPLSLSLHIELIIVGDISDAQMVIRDQSNLLCTSSTPFAVDKLEFRPRRRGETFDLNMSSSVHYSSFTENRISSLEEKPVLRYVRFFVSV